MLLGFTTDRLIKEVPFIDKNNSVMFFQLHEHC